MADYTFQVGHFISDGQYWDAPRSSGGIVRALCASSDDRWGSFVILWKFNEEDPGFPIFNVNAHTLQRHFATLEKEGFTLYEGSPVNPGKVLWRAPCPDADHGVLHDNGQMSLYDRSGNLRWRSAQNITADGVRTIHSWARPPILMLSSRPPTGGPDSWVSVQEFNDDNPHNRWELINLHADGNTYGILRSVATNQILYAEQEKGKPAKLSTRIVPESLWFFGRITDSIYSMETIANSSLCLNEAGDKPTAGGRVIMWTRTRPLPDNSTWGVSEKWPP